MIRRFKVVLTFLAVGIAGGCDDDAASRDILGVPANEALRVGIAGPFVIRETGTYQWQARLIGEASGAEFTWEVIRTDGPDESRRRIVASPVFETYVDLNDWGTFELVLTARAGDHLAVDRLVVTICPYIDEPVDECTAKAVLAR